MDHIDTLIKTVEQANHIKDMMMEKFIRLHKDCNLEPDQIEKEVAILVNLAESAILVKQGLDLLKQSNQYQREETKSAIEAAEAKARIQAASNPYPSYRMN